MDNSGLKILQPVWDLLEVFANDSQLLTTVESVLRVSSMVVAGKWPNQYVWSELIYSCANIVKILPQIVRYHRDTAIANWSEKTLLHWLSIIEAVEIFLEIFTRKLFDELGKWFVVVVLTVTKVLLRLTLIAKFRSLTGAVSKPVNVEAQLTAAHAATYELQSGRRIRTLDSSPAGAAGSVLADRRPLATSIDNLGGDMAFKLNVRERRLINAADMLYVSRPIAHLGMVAACGEASWKPWLTACAIDASSCSALLAKRGILGSADAAEVRRRQLLLLLYLLRNPMYDAVSSKLIARLAQACANVPIVGKTISTMNVYLAAWQQIYLHCWGN